jgi:hypothetical protein
MFGKAMQSVSRRFFGTTLRRGYNLSCDARLLAYPYIIDVTCTVGERASETNEGELPSDEPRH